MKKIILSTLLTFELGAMAQAQSVGINTDGSVADNSAFHVAVVTLCLPWNSL